VVSVIEELKSKFCLTLNLNSHIYGQHHSRGLMWLGLSLFFPRLHWSQRVGGSNKAP
jgi:hypothetical protein